MKKAFAALALTALTLLGLASTAHATAVSIAASAVCDSGGYSLVITGDANGSLKAYGDINGQASETDYGRISAGVPIPVRLVRAPGTYTGGVNVYFDNGKVSSAQYSVTVTINCASSTSVVATTTTVTPTTLAPTTTTIQLDTALTTSTTSAATTTTLDVPDSITSSVVTLPRTGGGSSAVGWGGLVLLLAGIGLVILGRRSPNAA